MPRKYIPKRKLNPLEIVMKNTIRCLKKQKEMLFPEEYRSFLNLFISYCQRELEMMKESDEKQS